MTALLPVLIIGKGYAMSTGNISEAWGRGDAYEQYVGRWSRQVAPKFLEWLDCAAGLGWLDVGCGPGTLCAAILNQCAPGSVTGVEPSTGFLETAKANLAGRVALYQGSAASIPLEDGTVDVVVSGLVLNFVPDARAALNEMRRVTRPGGMIAAYVWDYAGKMEMMRLFWDTASEMDPTAAQLDESIRFSLCSPERLEQLFAGAGLEQIVVTAIDIPTTFANFEDYWQPFLGGQGPAPTYTMSLDAGARARLRGQLQARIPAQPDGSIALIARAWAIRGQRPI